MPSGSVIECKRGTDGKCTICGEKWDERCPSGHINGFMYMDIGNNATHVIQCQQMDGSKCNICKSQIADGDTICSSGAGHEIGQWVPASEVR